MKYKRTMLAVMASFTLLCGKAQQQFWNSLPGGNVISTTEYLGAAATSTVPLHLLTIPNLRINFSTNNVLRMRLHETLPAQTIGIYTNENLSGNLGIGLFNTANVTRPFSLLHVDNGGNQFSGYRPWHRPGMTITNGTDLAWIGLKNEGGDVNHLTLAWADNTAVNGPDLFKVIFLANPGTTGTAGTLDGLETMRIQPRANGLESFFGIGDFFTAGANPTEHLHLLDGRARFQQLPDDPAAIDSFFVMVVDRHLAPNAERGVVKWVDPMTLGTGCDWVVQSGQPHVSNTYNGSSCSWDISHGVGIGLQYPKAKLHVFHTDRTLLSPAAVIADARFDLEFGQQFFGLHAQARPVISVGSLQNQQATGAFGMALNSRTSTGVHGFASTCTMTSGTASSLIGVKGVATGCERAGFVAGVYGEGTGAVNPADEWAAYFNGRGFLLNGPWQPSDEQLKTNIEPLAAAESSGADPLMSLPVYTYEYNAEAFPSMHFPSGTQTGFLAGELESLIPSAVTDMTHPALMDSLGNELTPAVDLKAINPLALVPYLVSTVQRQQAQMATMQEQLAACCSNPGEDGRMQLENGGLILGKDRDLILQPNPFSEPPTVLYTLERAGRMRLLANSADGKQLRVLREAVQEAGEYRMVWDTNALQPGMYYLTLLLDGEPIVKKAVKVVAR